MVFHDASNANGGVQHGTANMVMNAASHANGGIPASVLGAYGAGDKAKNGHATDSSALLYRNLHTPPRQVVASEGNYLTLSNGQRILDASCGAAVSCLGHGNERVKQAMMKQLDQVAYCLSIEFGTEAAEELAADLKRGTDGLMKKAYILNSDAAMKLARQYFLEISPPQAKRTKFIGRLQSYHGTTLGSLALGGHKGRRALFEPLLLDNCTHVSPCYPYRGLKDGESDVQYIARLAEELDAEFQRLGPETVCAFVAEPVVGAAMGCVPCLPGYFKAMEAVCRKYGALVILDEVMSGMGRCGTLHAWQHPAVGIVPDITTVGKGLGGGFQPVAAVLIGPRITDALDKGTGAFMHGQTYQGHPICCAAALEVQKQIREGSLVGHVAKMGVLLERGLRLKLDNHPHVGDIRGRGLFWGIEFVKEKTTKEPFDRRLGVGLGVHQKGLEEPYSISLYPGSGTADGLNGDHILLAPAYNITLEVVDDIVDRTSRVIDDYFAELAF